MGRLKEILSHELKKSAIPFGDELVLPFAEASAAVLIATEHEVAVLGVDAFEVRPDGLATIALFDASSNNAFTGDWKGLGCEASSVGSAEQQAVLAPIAQLFDGMEKRDAVTIKKPLLSGGTMVLMRDGKLSQMTFEDFADRVGKPGNTHIQERIHDPLVRIDHDLAVVWAPFEFLVDGKVDHCGLGCTRGGVRRASAFMVFVTPRMLFSSRFVVPNRKSAVPELHLSANAEGVGVNLTGQMRVIFRGNI